MSELKTRWRVQYKKPDQSRYGQGTAFYDRQTAHRVAKANATGLIARVVREERTVEATFDAEDDPND